MEIRATFPPHHRSINIFIQPRSDALRITTSNAKGGKILQIQLNGSIQISIGRD